MNLLGPPGHWPTGPSTKQDSPVPAVDNDLPQLAPGDGLIQPSQPPPPHTIPKRVTAVLGVKDKHILITHGHKKKVIIIIIIIHFLEHYLRRF